MYEFAKLVLTINLQSYPGLHVKVSNELPYSPLFSRDLRRLPIVLGLGSSCVNHARHSQVFLKAMVKVNKYGGALFYFSRTLFTSSFQGKLRFYEIFSRQKSLFVLLAEEKMLVKQHMWCREEKFTVFMYALRSFVKTLEWTTKLPRPNQAHVYFFIFPWPAL